jgi:hypothetical protein
MSKEAIPSFVSGLLSRRATDVKRIDDWVERVGEGGGWMLLPSEEAKEGVGEEGSCPAAGGKRKPGLLGEWGDRDGCPAVGDGCSSGEVAGSTMAGS